MREGKGERSGGEGTQARKKRNIDMASSASLTLSALSELALALCSACVRLENCHDMTHRGRKSEEKPFPSHSRRRSEGSPPFFFLPLKRFFSLLFQSLSYLEERTALNGAAPADIDDAGPSRPTISGDDDVGASMAGLFEDATALALLAREGLCERASPAAAPAAAAAEATTMGVSLRRAARPGRAGASPPAHGARRTDRMLPFWSRWIACR